MSLDAPKLQASSWVLWLQQVTEDGGWRQPLRLDSLQTPTLRA